MDKTSVLRLLRREGGGRVSEDEPLRCQTCAHNVPRDRREDFGDVVERWCDKCNKWLAWRDEPPCEKGKRK